MCHCETTEIETTETTSCEYFPVLNFLVKVAWCCGEMQHNGKIRTFFRDRETQSKCGSRTTLRGWVRGQVSVPSVAVSTHPPCHPQSHTPWWMYSSKPDACTTPIMSPHPCSYTKCNCVWPLRQLGSQVRSGAAARSDPDRSGIARQPGQIRTGAA